VDKSVSRRRRAYQRAVLGVLQGDIPTLVTGEPAFAPGGVARVLFLLWRRQGGKSTLLSEAALMAMIKTPGLTVTYASASLLLGREIILKESQALAEAFRRAAEGAPIETVDARTGLTLPDIDALADAFEHQRLELRLRHDRSTVSRTVVIAPNPATARGWSGWVFLDEFGFVRDLRELIEAVDPIISTQPAFRLIGATTPPSDDAHFSYELTAPPVGVEFPVDPAGNWYRSEAKKLIHRVNIYDAYAAGQKLYDEDDGHELTVEEHRAKAMDKDAWRRNYNVEHVAGGTAAVSILALKDAQKAGEGRCLFVQIEGDTELDAACAWLRENLGEGRLAAGFDVATSERDAANPSALAIVERNGTTWSARLVATWKTAEASASRAWMRRLIQQAGQRACLRRVERLAIDSSSERYFASDVTREFADLVPVLTVAGGEKAVVRTDEPMNNKTWLGKVLVSELEERRGALPADRYIYADFRRVKNFRGGFVTELGPGGEHGDTFDAVKLALAALDVDGGTSPAAQSSGRSTARARGPMAAPDIDAAAPGPARDLAEAAHARIKGRLEG
jgi:hypothetical protein